MRRRAARPRRAVATARRDPRTRGPRRHGDDPGGAYRLHRSDPQLHRRSGRAKPGDPGGPHTGNVHRLCTTRCYGTTLRATTAGDGCRPAGEAGEFANMIKKLTAHGHDIPVEDLADELGDVLWYLAEAATASGLSLDHIAQKNIQKPTF